MSSVIVVPYACRGAELAKFIGEFWGRSLTLQWGSPVGVNSSNNEKAVLAPNTADAADKREKRTRPKARLDWNCRIKTPFSTEKPIRTIGDNIVLRGMDFMLRPFDSAQGRQAQHERSMTIIANTEPIRVFQCTAGKSARSGFTRRQIHN
jgi:hypothetical protein